jgi:hypothetical protein
VSFRPDFWLRKEPILELHQGITVLRDDFLEGGSKLRFLPFLAQGAKEVVFGGPFCGGAPLALSVFGREAGVKVTLFYALRKNLHRRQLSARANGATLVWVPYGRMSNVQAKARQYAESVGALFLPLGFDVPAAEDPFVGFMRRLKAKTGGFDQIWCATGSGMLARCIARAFPESQVCAVAVGLASRWENQSMPSNVEVVKSAYSFEEETTATAPFGSCPNYDRKAWEIAVRNARGRALFWNVLA